MMKVLYMIFYSVALVASKPDPLPERSLQKTSNYAPCLATGTVVENVICKLVSVEHCADIGSCKCIYSDGRFWYIKNRDCSACLPSTERLLDSIQHQPLIGVCKYTYTDGSSMFVQNRRCTECDKMNVSVSNWDTSHPEW